MKKTYKIDDYGLLIGLVSTPEGISTADFFKQEIQNNLSGIYKKNRFGEKDTSTNLYTYKGYKTFGDHDLAVITLIDDFSYPNRVFHPSHGNRENADAKIHNYDYQVITCLNTISEEKKTSLETLLWNKSINIDRYPYICITRAKVSNYFLLGNGIECT